MTKVSKSFLLRNFVSVNSYYINKIKSWKHVSQFKGRRIKTFSIPEVDEPSGLPRKIFFKQSKEFWILSSFKINLIEHTYVIFHKISTDKYY